MNSQGLGALASVRYNLSGDGSVIAVYGYLSDGFGFWNLKVTTFYWDEPNSAPGQTATVTIANVGSDVQASAGIPSGMTADGQVQMVAAWTTGYSTLNKYISYNGGASWSAVSELNTRKCWAIFFSPTGSYTTIFTDNISSKAIIQAFTATTTGTRIVTPFVSSNGNQWPTYYQPDGPGTIQDALDIIARFMNANYGNTAGPGGRNWSEFT